MEEMIKEDKEIINSIDDIDNSKIDIKLNTKSNTKENEINYVKYNNEKKKVLKKDGENYLIEVTTTNLKGGTEKKKQWFHKSALEIIK